MDKNNQKKEKKKSKIEQHIRLLNQYHDVDFENNIVTVHAHFDSVEDLFYNSRVVKNGKKPLISDDVSNRFESILNRIPKHYKLNLEIDIDDYKDYSAEKLREIVYENLVMKKDFYRIKIHKNYHQAIILGAIGILFLIINILCQSFKLFGQLDGLVNLIVTEFIDIAAWVFIWEAVTISLLETAEHRNYLRSLNKSINDITFISGKASSNEIEK